MASLAMRALRRRSRCYPEAVDIGRRGGSAGLPASRDMLAPVCEGLHPDESKIGVRHAFNLASRGAPLTVKGTGGRSSVSGVIATVFGSTGFLGRYVVQQLAKMGSQVMIPYRGLEDTPRHLKPMGDLGQIVPMTCNIRDEDAIRTAISKSNVVINLIGRDYETRNYSFEEVNIEIAERIARLSAEHGGIARYVHASCLGADDQSPSKLYRTKAIGEEAVLRAFPGATILRPATFFGIEDRFLNRFAGISKTLPKIPIFLEGKTRVQPVHVVDVAAAVIAAVRDTDGTCMGKVYELGGPDVVTIHELLLWMFEVLREHPRIMNIPLPVAQAVARGREYFFKRIPAPLPSLWPFYGHYLDTLQVDQVVSPGALNFASLGIHPRSMRGIATDYLFYHRTGGPSMGEFRL